MKILLLVFAILFVSANELFAVNATISQADNERSSSNTVISGSLSAVDFSFFDSDQNLNYLFDGILYGVSLGAGNGPGIFFRYGTDTVQFGNLSSDVRLIHAGGNLGGNQPVLSSLTGRHLLLYVPIRAYLNYFNHKYYLNSQDQLVVFGSEASTLNMGSGSIGAGAGARLNILGIEADLFLTRSLGANVQFNDSDQFTGAFVQDDARLMVTLPAILTKARLTASYGYRSMDLNHETFPGFSDMLGRADVFESSVQSHTVSLGLRF
ncbi:MAG: hypothetical protein LAT67_08250 [Balneolales bacterium]|nr:hypothetical protein [Balneolales bacterium]